MSKFSLQCLFNRHDPRRSTVRVDGRDYVGTCRNCGKPIVRISHRLWHARKADG